MNTLRPKLRSVAGLRLIAGCVGTLALPPRVCASGDLYKAQESHGSDIEFYAGIFVAVVVGILLVWRMVRSTPLRLPLSAECREQVRSRTGPGPDDTLRFGEWFIRMRWLACGVSLILVVLTTKVLNYLEDEPFGLLVAAIALLALTNIAFTLMLKHRIFIHRLHQIQIVSDLILFTVLLHFSGGIENPLSFAYVFHVIIAGILLNRRECYLTAVGASMLFAFLAVIELTGVVEHYTLEIFPHEDEAGAEVHASLEPVYVACLVLLQVFLLSFVSYFTASIMARLREQEERARAERERLERVVHASGAGLAIHGDKLEPQWVNQRINEWLAPAPSAGSSAVSAWRKWTGDVDEQRAETLRDGTSRIVERERTVAGGERRVFQVTIAPLFDHAGRVYQVAELTQDITQRKRAEAAVMHAAKMAALGTMAAGIAHEVGNPLASLSTRLDLLRDNHDEEFLDQSISLLRDQISRIERIVRDISHFARPSHARWVEFDLNAVVRESVNMLRLHRLGKRCRIETGLDQSLPPAIGVRDQFNQIFLNLGLNALEAMKGNGTLTIRTGLVHGEINVSFADTGDGIGESIRKTIFEPFVSSKEGGLGLGLSIVKTVAEAHGGRVEARGAPDGGTVFRLFFPVESGTVDGSLSGRRESS